MEIFTPFSSFEWLIIIYTHIVDKMSNKSADISLRAQVLTLSYCTSASDQFIAAATSYSISQIYRIRRIAKEHLLLLVSQQNQFESELELICHSQKFKNELKEFLVT
jgi:hypothetical protein